jgi:RimJ/RimL family protein N-acetyltransferase
MYDYPADNTVLQELFDPDIPNSPALWAVLKGNYTGKALVDNEISPSACLLRTDAALCFFSQRTSQAFLDKALTHFRKAWPVWLVWPHKTSLHPPVDEDAVVVDRLEFFGCDPCSEVLREWRAQLPDGYSIQIINDRLLARCEWQTEMEFYAGSLSKFLEHGMGLCMMRDNEIIVEAYASSLGKTRAEIGAITREAYRGRNYAAIACAYLIDMCARQEYQAYWSCEADHQASIRVAQKLGFQQMRAYQIFEYDSMKVSQI